MNYDGKCKKMYFNGKNYTSTTQKLGFNAYLVYLEKDDILYYVVEGLHDDHGIMCKCKTIPYPNELGRAITLFILDKDATTGANGRTEFLLQFFY